MAKFNQFTIRYKVDKYDRPEIFTAAELVEEYLRNFDPELGSLETLESTAENTRKALGRLVETLYKAKVISRAHVEYVAKGY